MSVALIGHLLARTGNRPAALNIVRGLAEGAKHRYTPSLAFAVVYVGLGATDQAFASLEKAYDERFNRLAYLKTDPIWRSLHGDPRFDDLLRRIGLPR